ncbi:MAG TPA: hypothetical protein VKQ31_06040 [Steroidobacteraceae bacterium]|nr:hypothetical protein [Steroidobacteraceae bacterium]
MNVIVYDLPGDPGLEYHVPDPWVLQLTLGQRMDRESALAQIAREALPAQVRNIVFTTEAELPTLGQCRNRKIAALRAACQQQIQAGYASAALGAPHAYPATEVDQRNMTAAIAASLLPGLPADWTTPFWCADAGGTWAMRDHTAAEIQQAAADGRYAVIGAQRKLADLLVQVSAAASRDELERFAWSP